MLLKNLEHVLPHVHEYRISILHKKVTGQITCVSQLGECMLEQWENNRKILNYFLSVDKHDLM